MEDEKFMRFAFRLARLGKGFVSPNPLVGAVIVQRGRVVGIGYHRRYGEAHAEVRAIEDAGLDAVGGTMYVNLEPHSFHGKVPPCTDAIIRAGISRVVISNVDPNPRVSGKGIEILRGAGLEVKVGVLEEEGRRLNEVFFKWIRTGKPFVSLKFAMTLDGFIADPEGNSRWITSAQSRRFVHKLRAWSDAVAVGAGTVLKDNPRLTVRDYYAPRQPVKVIFDRSLRVWNRWEDFQIFDEGEIIIFNAQEEFEVEVRQAHVRGVKVENLEEALDYLGKMNITSLLVEGGSEILSQFMERGLYDKVYAFHAPKVLGRGISPFGRFAGNLKEKLRLHRVKRLDGDVLAVYYPIDEGT